jgi:hypothetical protein
MDFIGLKSSGHWWSTTAVANTQPNQKDLVSTLDLHFNQTSAGLNQTGMFGGPFDRMTGVCVRCLKD